MKKILICMLAGLLVIGATMAGCSSKPKTDSADTSFTAQNADNPYYEHATKLLQRDAKLSEKEADAAFNVFLDCGMMNDEMTYVFTTTDKNTYTVWVKLAQYDVTFDDNNTVNRIVDGSKKVIFDNGQRVTEEPTEELTQGIPETPTEVSTAVSTPITFTSYTDVVEAGTTATVNIQGAPNTQYFIQVYYDSGESKAAGLEAKTSDENGNVSWEWEVGTNTKKGEHTITVTGGGAKETVKFTVN